MKGAKRRNEQWSRITIVLFVFAATTFSNCMGNNESIDGCRIEQTLLLTKQLSTESNWENITIDNVNSLIPSFQPYEESRDARFKVLIYQGRIINGQCYCCIRWDFENSDPGTGKDMLVAITVFHSFETLKELTNQAPEILKSVNGKVDFINGFFRGSDPLPWYHQFNWQGIGPNNQQTQWFLDSKIYRNDKLFTFYTHYWKQKL